MIIKIKEINCEVILKVFPIFWMKCTKNFIFLCLIL